MRVVLERMWINQPSTLQQEHKLHGVNVLVSAQELKSDDEYVDVWFLNGDIHSQRCSKLALSKGWK